MKISFLKEINITGLRYPKVFKFNSKYYLIGSSKTNEKLLENNEKILQYNLKIYEIKDNFEYEFIDFIFLDEDRLDINNSYWIRDIYNENNNTFFLIEKKINKNNKYFVHINSIYKLEDKLIFKKIETIEDKINSFIFKIIDDKYFYSPIEIDKEDINFNWGIYLFNFYFKNEDKFKRPIFDKIVDYDTDKGHVLHNILKNNECYEFLFTIRHKIENEYIYKFYYSKTSDFINFTETKLIEIDFKNTDSKWISYPNYFEINNKKYILSNSDDFGKNKNLILFEVSF